MATSSIVFVALVVFATTIPIAAFAWVAGNKRQKDPSATPDNIQQSVKADPPQFRRREAWADERRPQHSAWPEADIWATAVWGLCQRDGVRRNAAPDPVEQLDDPVGPSGHEGYRPTGAP